MGSALNPYEDNFKCAKNVPFGKCASTPEIYAEVVPGYKPEGTVIPANAATLTCKECGKGIQAPSSSNVVLASVEKDPQDYYRMALTSAPKEPTPVLAKEATVPAGPSPEKGAESAYREASLAKMAKMLKEPVTPIVVPPSVMRIWMAPRQGENKGVLDMGRFVFMMVEDPHFVMGDYLNQAEE